ncbi:MAG: YheC/YheD family protein [Thermoflavifilum sp.]|nr:YheC/YheD family protein [Thermoflavifilum sp.]MCL6513453.1 YheC/YheD family protein [Alicyclobacillus sp.]
MKVRIWIDPRIPPDAIRVSAACSQPLEAIEFAGNVVSPSMVRCTRGVRPGLAVGTTVGRVLGLRSRMFLHGRMQDGHLKLGPCLALYAERAYGRRPFQEQTELFRDLARLGARRGVAVAVLVPGDWARRRAYLWTGSGWRRGRLMAPDIVLRRSGVFAPSRFSTAWREIEDLRSAGLLHTLPRECSDKWALYRWLHTDSEFRRHLPRTEVARTARDIWMYVKQRKDVYVKPVHGTGGRGVIRVQWAPKDAVRVTYHSEMGDSRTRTEMLTDLADWQRWWRLRGLRDAVMQDALSLLRTDDDRPIDFRWLVQWVASEPRVVARVGRIGGPGAVTTNLHTGADAVWAVDAMQKAGVSVDHIDTWLDEMDTLALQVARALRDRYGAYAECGVDLARDMDGQLYLLEVNPTPGRRMLRQLDPGVRRWSLDLLLEYAITAAGYAGGQR